MPYVTGTATDFADLKSALTSACTANGWMLSGNVLHKGAVYVELLAAADKFTIKGGTGIDGSNALTGAAAGLGRIGALGSANVVFPATYHVHIGASPDEVYFTVNYNVNFWQWMAFGQSDVPGLPGVGCWFSASLASALVSGVYLTPTNSGSRSYSAAALGLFFSTDNNTNNDSISSSVHHGLDGGGWSTYGNVLNGAQALAAATPKYGRQPNAWNAASALINCQVYVRRVDNKQSLVVDMAHVRLLRIDNYQPGDIITLGSDQWKVYPWLRKDANNRNGNDPFSPGDHSGTMGFAVRYDGP